MATVLAGFVLSACAGTPAAAPEEPPVGGEWVYVTGDVEKPGRVPVVHGRTPFTLLKALALAEPVGEPGLATCLRPHVGMVAFDVDAVQRGAVEDPQLHRDDVVTVSARR